MASESTTTAPLRVLITGVTGYIGGTILTQLLNSTLPHLQNKLEFSALIREDSSSSRSEVLKSHNITPIPFTSLDQFELLKNLASEHDIVINNASAFHDLAAKALIEGLALRRGQHQKGIYIHTSGTSSIGDRSVSNTFHSLKGQEHVLSDAKPEELETYLRDLQSLEEYRQRTTDLVVLDTARQLGVPTYIIMSPTIYGCGTGFFNKNSIQIPGMMRAAIKRGKAEVMGTGENRWDHVHVQDLAVLYELLLEGLLREEEEEKKVLPEGIYFSSTGNHSWRDIAVNIAKSGKKLGLLGGEEVVEIDVEEAVKAWGKNSKQWVELGFGSNSRSRADLAKQQLGWEPKYTDEDFYRSFDEEMQIIAKQMEN